jgi:hypothetical protein
MAGNRGFSLIPISLGLRQFALRLLLLFQVNGPVTNKASTGSGTLRRQVEAVFFAERRRGCGSGSMIKSKIMIMIQSGSGSPINFHPFRERAVQCGP